MNCSESTAVEEVVILGDLFDRWLVPAALEPTISFQEICDNDANKKIITALQELAERKIVTYVPGNHDMSFSPADQLETRRFMGSLLPKNQLSGRSGPAPRGL